MQQRKILIIEGHPDPSDARLNHALSSSYAEGARIAGHDVRSVRTATLSFPLLRTAEQFYDDPVPSDIAAVQDDIRWANHLVVIYPMWLGGLPALFRAFMEQTFRPGFRLDVSAHFVVTMDATTVAHRLYLRTFLKHLHRNVLQFADVTKIDDTLLGGARSAENATIKKWIARMREYGRTAR